jgi:hypothetical protein
VRCHTTRASFTTQRVRAEVDAHPVGA